MSHTEGKCEVVHTNWRTSILVFGGRIMAECNVDPDFDEDNASDVEAEDAEMEKAANARRLAALWNAAEELVLTTEQVEDGIIQMTFIDGRARLQECISEKKEAQRAAGRLKDQYENVSKHYSRRGGDIERLEAEKAESEYALGFAVEAVERLEAEKNEMRDVITKLLQVVEFYEPVDRHRELIRRAKTTIGREEE